jgi:hypothetical protein
MHGGVSLLMDIVKSGMEPGGCGALDGSPWWYYGPFPWSPALKVGMEGGLIPAEKGSPQRRKARQGLHGATATMDGAGRGVGVPGT